MYNSFPSSWSLYNFIKIKPLFQAVHQSAHQIPYLHHESPHQSNRSAMVFMSVLYTMAILMKCMLSFSKYQPNMKQQEQVNIRKVQIIPNQRQSQNL